MWAAEVYIFCPLMTYSSPSRTARHCSEARSAPACGSVKPSANENSPLISFGMKCHFCSSVPAAMIAGAPLPPRPSEMLTRANSSSTMYCDRRSPPWPPYSFG